MESGKEMMEMEPLISVIVPIYQVEELAEELSVDKWERRKWDAFSEGTIEGCKKTVYYHRKMEKARAQKKKWKKILKL